MHAKECFACGDVPGSLRMRTVVGEGTSVTSSFVVTDEHIGATGLAHGGLLSGAFDEAFGATSVLVRRPVVTGTMQVSYHRPVPVGATLHLRCAIDATAGRRLFMSGEGRLDGSDGPLALRAHAVYMQVDREHFERHGTPGHGSSWLPKDAGA